jgi:hypothetical protein
LAESDLPVDPIEQGLIGFNFTDVKLQQLPTNHIHGLKVEMYLPGIAYLDEVHSTRATLVGVPALGVPWIYHCGTTAQKNLPRMDVAQRPIVNLGVL